MDDDICQISVMPKVQMASHFRCIICLDCKIYISYDKKKLVIVNTRFDIHSSERTYHSL